MTAFSNRSLSGIMFAPLTADRGKAVLTWYLAGFPARTSVSAGGGSVLPGSEAGYGERCDESLARLCPDTSLWKTHQCCLDGDYQLLSEIWPDWGITRSGEFFPLAPLVHHIHGSDCFYWHTPTANDCKPAGQSEMSEAIKWLAGGTTKNTYIRLRSLLAARCGRREPPNPPFLEWLMGWPIGWTEIKPLGMGRFQSWLNLHGKCCHNDDPVNAT
jgi:hypothetical protein